MGRYTIGGLDPYCLLDLWLLWYKCISVVNSHPSYYMNNDGRELCFNGFHGFELPNGRSSTFDIEKYLVDLKEYRKKQEQRRIRKEKKKAEDDARWEAEARAREAERQQAASRAKEPEQAPPAQEVKIGYFQKSGGGKWGGSNKRFKRRFFKLTADKQRIEYYVDDTSKTPKGHIPLPLKLTGEDGNTLKMTGRDPKKPGQREWSFKFDETDDITWRDFLKIVQNAQKTQGRRRLVVLERLLESMQL